MSSPIPPPLPEEQLRYADQQVRRSRSRRRWLVFFLVLSLIFNLYYWTRLKIVDKSRRLSDSGSVFTERVISGKKDADAKIALIRVEGLISSQMEGHVGYDGMVGDIKEQLRLASEDDDIKAVIVRIDSPGGEVLASDEIYNAIKKLRMGAHKKPIICSMGSLAASGGYYSAVGTEYIIADELTITGSIGVIMQTLNYKDLFGKVGLRSYVFKSGKFKDILNGSREPTPEEMELVQALINETYEKFLSIVATERNLDAEYLRNHIADGRILSGKQAFETKLVDKSGKLNGTLVDKLGNLDVAIEEAKSRAGVSDAKVVDYVVPFSFSNILGMFTEAKAPKIQVNIVPTSDVHLEQGKLYFIAPGFY